MLQAEFSAKNIFSQKRILPNMSSGIFMPQAKFYATGKVYLKMNPTKSFACSINFVFRKQAGIYLGSVHPTNQIYAAGKSACGIKFLPA